jgi:transposase
MMHAGGRPLVIAWQDGDDVTALRAAYQAEERRDVRVRLHTLWRLREGDRIRDVARLVGVHERSVQQWVAWYRAGGRAAVTTPRRQGKGKTPWLTTDQQARLCAHAATGAIHTAAQARAWVADTFGVSYTEGGMYAVLGRLTIHPKVPRPVNPKTDLAAQERWKKGGLRPR